MTPKLRKDREKRSQRWGSKKKMRKGRKEVRGLRYIRGMGEWGDCLPRVQTQ